MGDNVATTEWSQVLTARDGSDTEARQALERLCQTYWQPLYAYVRHQGAAPEEARDLTQGYFAELLEKSFLTDVDPAKGRFRSFLLASLRHYLSHQREFDRALKRGGSAVTFSLDASTGEDAYANQPVEEMTPEDVFEYRWAITVLDRAVGRLRREWTEKGTESQFRQLQQYLTGAGSEMPYRETALALGLSETAIRSAVRRLRIRLGECLRAEILETVANVDDVDEEVRYLLGKVRP